MKEEILDKLATAFVRILMSVFERVPLNMGLCFGRGLGRILFLFGGEKKKIIYANLKSALGNKLTPKELLKIRYEHYIHIGQMVVEVLSSGQLTPKYAEENIKIYGEENLKAALNLNKGCVCNTAHMGNWELLGLYMGLRGFSTYVVGNVQKFPRLNKLLNQTRERHGAVAVNRGVAVRTLLKALKDKKIVGALGDQSARSKGVIMPFFGRRTTVPDGIYEMRERTNSSMIPVFIARTKNEKHEIHWGDLIDIDLSLEPQARIEAQMEKYLTFLEKAILQFPEQWVWETKRWKFCWDRRIVILSDRKAGHFKQSETIAEMFKENNEFEGREGLRFETETIEIEYRSKFYRSLLFVVAFLLKPFIQGRLWLLSFFVTKETYELLEKSRADFLIAAGSSLASMQMLLAEETKARKIVIMNPPFPYNKTQYNLAIVPLHDAGNVPTRSIRMSVMPSAFKLSAREEDAKILLSKLGEKPKPRISVFIGGATRRFDLGVDTLEKMASVLKRVEKFSNGFLLTTSRRTSHEAKKFLKQSFLPDSACKFLTIANEENPPFVVGGMLEIADLIIITEDSLAMISEAVGSGKQVIVVKADGTKLPDKHYRFHQALKDRKLITMSALGNLEENIYKLLNEPTGDGLRQEKEMLKAHLRSML